jgi:hypothetical protein
MKTRNVSERELLRAVRFANKMIAKDCKQRLSKGTKRAIQNAIWNTYLDGCERGLELAINRVVS